MKNFKLKLLIKGQLCAGKFDFKFPLQKRDPKKS